MATRPVPLRRRLLLLAAVAILPLALMSGIGLFALVHQQRQQAERAGIEITRALSTAVDAELGDQPRMSRDDAVGLWRQRVQLMEGLVNVHAAKATYSGM